MWLFTPFSFLSIVQKPDQVPGTLTARARAAGDLEKVFPGVAVTHSTDTDYPFRAVVRREMLKDALCRVIDDLDYPNFKSATVENDRHFAYFEVWKAMAAFQRGRERPARPHAQRTHLGRAAPKKLLSSPGRR